RDNRRKENVEIFLKKYKGILMADGYEPYHTVARLSNGDIVVAGCWAHYSRNIVIPDILPIIA
ncbi:MAG: transposase, partial [Butyrivibrio sp.]|nr:transposase [Butyrivibrio sp.]